MRVKTRLKWSVALNVAIAAVLAWTSWALYTPNSPVLHVLAVCSVICTARYVVDAHRAWRALRSPFLYLVELEELCTREGRK